LRRIVIRVRPPALESPDGLTNSNPDRISMLAASGIKPEIELDLTGEMSLDFRSMVFRQVAEAISNVERHSKATEVKVSLTTVDGGVLWVTGDNGQGCVGV